MALCERCKEVYKKRVGKHNKEFYETFDRARPNDVWSGDE
jgi:hypothetical protein